jgi:small subunit ribosomal protein S16
MSVSIKLSRIGAKKCAFYRIVASTTRNKINGEHLEILGSYNPKFKKLELDKKKMDEWIKKGAIVTTGVKKVLNLDQKVIKEK